MPRRGWHRDSCPGWKIQSLGRTQPACCLWGSRMRLHLCRYLGQLQDFPLASPAPWSLQLLGFPSPGADFLHFPPSSSAGFCLSPPWCLPARCRRGLSGSRCICRECCHCCSGIWGIAGLGLHSSCAVLWSLRDMQDKCLELATELWGILDLHSNHLIGRSKSINRKKSGGMSWESCTSRHSPGSIFPFQWGWHKKPQHKNWIKQRQSQILKFSHQFWPKTFQNTNTKSQLLPFSHSKSCSISIPTPNPAVAAFRRQEHTTGWALQG